MSARLEINAAAEILNLTLELLLAMPKKIQGRAGSDLRAACNRLRVNAETALASDQFAEWFGECFELARETGGTLLQFEALRREVAAQQPTELLAIAVKQSAIQFALEQQARVLSQTEFESRQDVEQVQKLTRDVFAQAIEIAADDMEQSTFQALTALAAAVQFYLYDTARPLPRMIRYQFAQGAPTLVFAYRLYDDASRCDELRVENKVVHPAFAKRTGRALSA